MINRSVFPLRGAVRPQRGVYWGVGGIKKEPEPLKPLARKNPKAPGAKRPVRNETRVEKECAPSRGPDAPPHSSTRVSKPPVRGNAS
ncbi:hypothetical protein NDU88_002635 [Pleurodeles waltl]|uniref:Uncharacterized protein n=1 Tax=Pleurodeles waltl TaxID=8319 RepID=A0AAV7T2T5_PLEWA|nr:hypothetical protein NDU88_002635 [Pleurodeles waltl]